MVKSANVGRKLCTLRKVTSTVSIAVPIIGIIVVWAFVLAPWLLRSQRPMSHTGEAFDDTRVLFEGDSGNVAARRRPRLGKRDVRLSEADDEDFEVIDAADISVVDDKETEAVTIAGAAAKAKAHPRQPGSQLGGKAEAAQSALSEEAEHTPETIEGELVEDDNEVTIVGSAETKDEPSNQSELAQNSDNHESGSKGGAAAEDADDVEEDDLLIEDETKAGEDSDVEVAEDVQAEEAEVFSTPAVADVAEDAYEIDSTYTSPVDLMYPGAVDSAEQVSQIPHAIEAEEEQESELAEDTDLSADEVAFAQRRLGRGGWDPVAEKAASANRYQRRQRTLIGLAVAVVFTVALGIVFGGWTWTFAALAGLSSIVYLVALRTQVRQEQALLQRRVYHLRRARLGVRNAEDEALAIPRNLRRPGAVVLEIDDDSPDFDHLPVHFDDDEFDGFDGPHATNRQRRDDLASRRVS